MGNTKGIKTDTLRSIKRLRDSLVDTWNFEGRRSVYKDFPVYNLHVSVNLWECVCKSRYISCNTVRESIGNFIFSHGSLLKDLREETQLDFLDIFIPLPIEWNPYYVPLETVIKKVSGALYICADCASMRKFFEKDMFRVCKFSDNAEWEFTFEGGRGRRAVKVDCPDTLKPYLSVIGSIVMRGVEKDPPIKLMENLRAPKVGNDVVLGGVSPLTMTDGDGNVVSEKCFYYTISDDTGYYYNTVSFPHINSVLGGLSREEKAAPKMNFLNMYHSILPYVCTLL